MIMRLFVKAILSVESWMLLISCNKYWRTISSSWFYWRQKSSLRHSFSAISDRCLSLLPFLKASSMSFLNSLMKKGLLSVRGWMGMTMLVRVSEVDSLRFLLRSMIDYYIESVKYEVGLGMMYICADVNK